MKMVANTMPSADGSNVPCCHHGGRGRDRADDSTGAGLLALEETVERVLDALRCAA
jgi:hypothetical protein